MCSFGGSEIFRLVRSLYCICWHSDWAKVNSYSDLNADNDGFVMHKVVWYITESLIPVKYNICLVNSTGVFQVD